MNRSVHEYIMYGRTTYGDLHPEGEYHKTVNDMHKDPLIHE